MQGGCEQSSGTPLGLFAPLYAPRSPRARPIRAPTAAAAARLRCGPCRSQGVLGMVYVIGRWPVSLTDFVQSGSRRLSHLEIQPQLAYRANYQPIRGMTPGPIKISQG
jgi:hypothetical protein